MLTSKSYRRGIPYDDGGEAQLDIEVRHVSVRRVCRRDLPVRQGKRRLCVRLPVEPRSE